MTNVVLEIPPEFNSATKEQRIAFVQALWDQIAQDPANVPIPEHHKRILEERIRAYRANPQSGRPWSEVRDEILEKFRNP